MIGAPSLFIDRKGPSITGIISNISTTIDSRGQAISAITFRNAKIIFDNEVNSAFFALPDKNNPNATAEQVLKDFVSESFVGASSLLYDSNLYGPYTIGLDAYSYMFYGKHHKRKYLNEFAGKMAEDSG